MKIKNEKGITMIMLVIIILMLLILGSITVFYAQDLVNVAKMESATTNMLLIQAKVRIINEKVIFEKDEDEKAKLLVGSKLSDNPNVIARIEENHVLENTEDYSKFYVLSQKELNDMGLDTVASSDGYIVNYETEEIIYLKGVKNKEGNLEYKLSDILSE